MQQLFADTNRDPGIYSPYREMLRQWRAHGGQMFMHFTSSSLYDQHGYWGMLEFQDQEIGSSQSAPKFRAAMDYIATNPMWW